MMRMMKIIILIDLKFLFYFLLFLVLIFSSLLSLLLLNISQIPNFCHKILVNAIDQNSQMALNI